MADKDEHDTKAMSLSEAAKYLERDDLTDAQRQAAIDRINEISGREKEQADSMKEDAEYLGRSIGSYTLAHGGKIHRGRKAGVSAEKTR